MAYYSGQASSYQELQNVLVNACVAQGWSWADGILSYSELFLKITSQVDLSNGQGLSIQGGTGKNGNNLINGSMVKPRIGDLAKAALIPNITFPIQFKIFIFDNPVECFLVIRFAVDRFMYLAFGMSTIKGSSIWISGSISNKWNTETSQSYAKYNCFSGYPSGGGQTGIVPSWSLMTGFFWKNEGDTDADLNNSAIYSEVDDIFWGGVNQIQLSASDAIQPLFSRLPSKWSDNSPLLPVQVSLSRPSNKKSIVTEIHNARYLRIDNYEPEQIITLGFDKWMIFPFHKKNITSKDAGYGIDHSGTLGWAIRYDGP